jgi:hypothetical protein
MLYQGGRGEKKGYLIGVGKGKLCSEKVAHASAVKDGNREGDVGGYGSCLSTQNRLLGMKHIGSLVSLW